MQERPKIEYGRLSYAEQIAKTRGLYDTAREAVLSGNPIAKEGMSHLRQDLSEQVISGFSEFLGNEEYNSMFIRILGFNIDAYDKNRKSGNIKKPWQSMTLPGIRGVIMDYSLDGRMWTLRDIGNAEGLNPNQTNKFIEAKTIEFAQSVEAYLETHMSPSW